MAHLDVKAVQLAFFPVTLAALVALAATSPAGDSKLPGLRGCRAVQRWDMAMTYGFTMDASQGIAELERKQREKLLPDLEDLDGIPFLVDIVEWFQRTFSKDDEDEVVRDPREDLSNFPLTGCTVKANRAFCRAQLDITQPGFDWKADVAFQTKYSATTWVDPFTRRKYVEPPFKLVRPNVTQALFVDRVMTWMGMGSARRPNRRFGLFRQYPPVKDGEKPKPLSRLMLNALPMKVVASSQSPDGSTPPMEIAVRYDNLQVKPRFMKASVRFECFANGESIANVTAGEFRCGTD